MKRPVIVGVSGGTASGKTTISQAIVRHVSEERVAWIQHDAYYRDLSHLPMAERIAVNFDHPSSLESDLLVLHLDALCAGVPVQVPIYDFARHVRCAQTRAVEPKPLILVEGILIFVEPALRDRFDIKIYVDADPDLRFIRRLRRDVRERARTMDSVVEQYLATVRPMHLEFVEPSKRHADVIIPGGGFNKVAIDLVATKVMTLIEDSAQDRARAQPSGDQA